MVAAWDPSRWATVLRLICLTHLQPTCCLVTLDQTLRQSTTARVRGRYELDVSSIGLLVLYIALAFGLRSCSVLCLLRFDFLETSSIVIGLTLPHCRIRHENEGPVVIGLKGRLAYQSRQETDELFGRPAFGMNPRTKSGGLVHDALNHCTAATATSTAFDGEAS